MKKKLLTLVAVVLSFLSFASSAFAAPVNLIECPTAPFNVLCFNQGNISDIIGAAISFIFIIGVIIALFYLLWGAVRWINSGGDKAAIEGARGQIIASIVGLIILFFAFAIFTILLTFFNINDITKINIPQLPTPKPLP